MSPRFSAPSLEFTLAEAASRILLKCKLARVTPLLPEFQKTSTSHKIKARVLTKAMRPYIFQPDHILAPLSLFPPSQPHTPSCWATLSRLLPQCLCTSCFLFPRYLYSLLPFLQFLVPIEKSSLKIPFIIIITPFINGPACPPSSTFIFSLQLLSPSSTLWLAHPALFHRLPSPS